MNPMVKDRSDLTCPGERSCSNELGKGGVDVESSGFRVG
jgi:hypothetical protein